MSQQVVRLSVPAEAGWVSLVRSTAVAVASRLELDLDALEDLRLAVGECAAMAVAGAPEGSTLDAVLELEGDQVRVTVSGAGHLDSLPAKDTFAWALLEALVVDISVEQTSDGVAISLRASAASPRVDAT